MDINQLSFSIKGSASDATKSLEALSTSLRNVSKNFSVASKQGKAFVSVNSSLSSSSSVIKKTSTNMSSLTRTMSLFTSSTKKSEDMLGKWIKRATQLSIAVMLVKRSLDSVIDGIQRSISYTENLNLFTVALGENAQRATGFLEEMSSAMYIDQAELTRTLGLFYQISNALGLSAEKAYTLGTNFTKMAYDIASFYNITVDDAVTKLQAGLVGETEPLRRVGIIITENNLAETARTLGITKSIRMMTEQEKIQLRYITTLQQTTKAQGDMARTMLQPENLLRALKEQFQILTRNIGNAFIPILEKLVPKIIAVTSALADLAEQFGKLFGYKAPEISTELSNSVDALSNISDETEDVEKSTSKTLDNLIAIVRYTKELDSLTSGIDELNILNKTTSVTFPGLFSSVGAGATTESGSDDLIDIPLPDYDNFMSKATTLFSELKVQYTEFFDGLIERLRGVFDEAKEAYYDMVDEIGLGRNIDWIETIGTTADIINDVLVGVFDGMREITATVKTVWNNYLQPIFSKSNFGFFSDLADGTLTNAVKRLFELFVTYKVLSFLKTLTATSKALGTFMALLQIEQWKFNIDTSDGLEELDKLKDKMIMAVSAGLGAAVLSKNAGIGLLTLGLALSLPFEDLEKWQTGFISAITAGLGAAIISKSGSVGIITFTVAIGFQFKEEIQGFFKELDKQLLDFFYNHKWLADLLHVDFDTWTGRTGYDPFAMANESARSSLEGMGVNTQSNAFANMLKQGGMSMPSLISTIAPKVASLNDILSNYESGIIPSLGGKSKLTDTLWNNIVSMLSTKFWKSIKVDRNIMWSALDSVPNNDMLSKRVETLLDMGVTDSDTIVKTLFNGMGYFANGGVPKKGNLFVAGEDGPELVTEHNGETVVMNEKQLAMHGIQLFADGTSNVPTTKYAGVPGILSVLTKVFMDLPFTFIDVMKGMFSDLGYIGAQLLDRFIHGPLMEKIGKGINFLTKPLQVGFGGIWEGLKNSKAMQWVIKNFSELSDVTLKVVGVMGKTLLTAVMASYQAFKESAAVFSSGSDEDKQNLALDSLGAALGDTGAGAIFSLLQQVESGAVTDFLDNLPEFIKQGIEAVKNLIKNVTKVIPDIVNVIPDVINSIVSFLTDEDSLNKIIESIITIVNAIVVALPDILTALVNAIPMIIGTLIDAFMNNLGLFLQLGWNIGVSILEGIANILVTGINFVLRGINAIIPGHRWDISLIDNVDFSWMYMADGGFPTTGQMFVAREAGPELVGSIGGQSAVVNNDQIVEAVSKGVYDAVSNAIAEQSMSAPVVYLDGKKISDNQSRVSKTRGLRFGMETV